MKPQPLQVSMEAVGAQFLEALEPLGERTEELESVTADLTSKLDQALRVIADLQERERKRNEKMRKARITRAADAAGMTIEKWIAYCKKHDRDPEFYLEKKLKAPRYR